MASLAPLPPTPQQSFAHMAGAPQGSPPHPTPNGLPYGAHSYNMSFESTSQPSFPSGPPQTYPMPGYSRSFGALGDGYGGNRGAYEGKPQIYTVRPAASRLEWVELVC